MKKLLVSIASVLFSLIVRGQETDAFFAKSNAINRTGMLVMGGWAVSNMLYGGYGSAKFENDKKYFHQMNLMWNVVNASIAGFALYKLGSTDLSAMSAEQMMAKHNQTQNLYIINAGLDLLYIAGGAYMVQVSGKNEKHRDRLKGYGQSVVLQGGFLLVFDLALFLIQQNHEKNFVAAASFVSLTNQGITLSLQF